MAWFIDESEIKRQGALELLEGFGGVLPGLYDLQLALKQGCSPLSISERLWIVIQKYATEAAAQANQRANFLGTELSKLQNDRDLWKEIAERNQAYKLRQELEQAQKQIQENAQRAKQAEHASELLQKTLERERQASQLELSQCQQLLKEQAQIIAEQHQKLERLLGLENHPTKRA